MREAAMFTRTERMTPARGGWLGIGLGSVLLLALGAGRWWLAPTADQLVMQAQADYQAGRTDAAALGLAKVARLRVPTPMDRMARALVARARGQGKDALSELAHIPDDPALSAEAHLLAGQIEVENGRLRLAESHFLTCVAREPTNSHAHRELAYIYNVQHRLREMDAQMDALSELSALGFEHLLHWGKTRNVVWDPSRDCQSLAKYLAADPDDRYTRLALVDGLQNLGRLEEAASVLAFLPDSDDEARARRALLTLAGGDAAQADRLLAAGPVDHPSLAKARGQIALGRHNPGGALPQLRIALAAHPDDFGVLSALATTLRALGDEVGAKGCIEAQRRHTAVTPLIAQAATPAGASDPGLPARLGAACEAAGRLAEARAWYRLVITRDPLDSQSQQAVFRLSDQLADRARFAGQRGPPPAMTANRQPRE
jgi:tetratricopeptide (TPR) repeat protein